jgi:hypothetical protein
VVLERVPLSLVRTIEELLEKNNSDSGLENREYGCGEPLRWPRDTLCPQKLTQTSPTIGIRSVGLVCSQTKATKLLWVCLAASPLYVAVEGRCDMLLVRKENLLVFMP